jgi:hypothetical protein
MDYNVYEKINALASNALKMQDSPELSVIRSVHVFEEFEQHFQGFVINVARLEQYTDEEKNQNRYLSLVNTFCRDFETVREICQQAYIVAQNFESLNIDKRRAEELIEEARNLTVKMSQAVEPSKYALDSHEKGIQIDNLKRSMDKIQLSNSESILNERLSKVKKLNNEALKVLNIVQNKASEQAVVASVNHFEELQASHKTHQENWFYAFLAFAFLFLATILYIYFFKEVSTIITIATSLEFLKNGLLISLFGLGMKISLSKYNTERSLLITYMNRESVLQQYKIFEATIGDDTAGKNELRIEVARNIFADPPSNYSVSSKSSDININPVFTAVEKLTSSASKLK